MSEQSIFLAALDLSDPAERAAYVAATCGDNAVLRNEIAALLAAHERPGPFLDEPAVAQMTDPGTGETRTMAPGGDPGFAKTRAPDSVGAGEHDVLAILLPPTRPGSLGRLAHYEVQEVLGRGGFGTVLKAFDDRLHRVVAIKVMAPQLAASGAARARFLREGRSAAAVRDDHVVNVHAVSADDEPIPYLVMEFVAGQTLQHKLDKTGPLPAAEILRIGSQVARGLAAAHATGLIHRDIKPANILLENGVERVKITDFGLARAADDASISYSGAVAGTPQYMAPEQARGAAIDHRADLFSLGSVLYAMCTGHPPFRAETALAVLNCVCEDDPRPVRAVNPAVPQWLADVVAKLHAKNPADRFQTAKDVADLLARYLTELQLTGTVSPPEPDARPAVSAPFPHIGFLWWSPALLLCGSSVLAFVLSLSLQTEDWERVKPWAGLVWLVLFFVTFVVVPVAQILSLPRPTPRPRPRPRRVTLVVAALAVVALAGVGAYALIRQKAPRTGDEGWTTYTAEQEVPGWGRVVDPDGDGTVQEKDERLRITVPGKDHDFSAWFKSYNAPRIVREVRGDFRVRVRVLPFKDIAKITDGPGKPYLTGDLFLWKDERTFVRLGRTAATDESGERELKNDLVVFRPGLGESTPFRVDLRDLDPDAPSYLELERRGAVVTARTSTDGANWSKPYQLPPLDLPETVLVGVVAVCTNTSEPFRVEFEGFELTPLTPSKDDGWVPLFNGTDLTGWEGDKNDCLWADQELRMKAVRGTTEGTAHLWTVKTFRDYEVKLQVRYQSMNGGFQIIPRHLDVPHDMNAVAPFFLRWSYGDTKLPIPANEASSRFKRDQFNDVVMRCVDRRVTVRLNGETISDQEWPALVAEGALAFHIFGSKQSDVCIRNVYVRKVEPKEPPAKGAPNPAAVQALRDTVAARTRTRDDVKLRFEAGTVSKIELLVAEADLTEARIKLAQEEQKPAAVVELLDALVKYRRDERELIALRVEVGAEPADALNRADARLADAKARLARVRPPLPVAPAPRPKP
jgi:serine/threonine protein kinase